MMKKFVLALVVVGFGLMSESVYAATDMAPSASDSMSDLMAAVSVLQTTPPPVAGPASKLAWDEIGEVPAVANASTYNIYDTKPDNTQGVIAVNSATCGPGPTAADSTCVIPIPALVPGKHTLTMTQVQAGAESNKSVPLVLTFVVIVTPTNVRVQ